METLVITNLEWQLNICLTVKLYGLFAIVIIFKEINNAHNLDKSVFRKFFMVEYFKRNLFFVNLIKSNDESS